LLGTRAVVRRLALLALLLAVAAAAPASSRLRPGARPDGCVPAPAGEPPRHWLACAHGPATRTRPLADDERLLLGLPLDLNASAPEALAFVPGLGRRLAAAVAADRSSRGPFSSVEELRRVSGIGEKRLAQARERLYVDPP
jgi:competence protein ComEA